MEIKEIQKIDNEVTTDVICDCCGKSCRMYYTDVNEQSHYNFEFMTLETHWGYFSDKDTEKWTAQVCEKCVDEKLSFIKFKKSNYL